MGQTRVKRKKLATLQVDVDPFWFIASNYNQQKEFTHPTSIYETAIPLYLKIFRKYDVKATFFIVGKDLADSRNDPFIESILTDGHEIANHTLNHDPKLNRLTKNDIIHQIDHFSHLLEKKWGIVPQGFKAPAYALNEFILNHLEDRGYGYDSSVFPCLMSPAVRWVQKFLYKKGRDAYGDYKMLFANLYPYHPSKKNLIHKGNLNIMEIPVSTMPLIRLPFHFSFVNTSGYPLFRTGKWLVDISKLDFLNYAFHAIDILDTTSIPPIMHNRPGMRVKTEAKCKNIEKIIMNIMADYTVLKTMDIPRQIRSEK